MSTTATTTKNTLSHMDNIRHEAGEIASDVQNKVKDQANKLKDQAKDCADKAQARFSDVYGKVNGVVKEHPLTLLGVGLLAGLALGAMTRK